MFLKSKSFRIADFVSFCSGEILTRSMSTLRIMGVPGHGQTAQAFREKSGCVRGKLKNKCEFVYIDPPFYLEPCDHGGWSRTWIVPIPLDEGDSGNEGETFYHVQKGTFFPE